MSILLYTLLMFQSHPVLLLVRHRCPLSRSGGLVGRIGHVDQQTRSIDLVLFRSSDASEPVFIWELPTYCPKCQKLLAVYR
ncbi:hypothetical protein F4859DRAFT_495403 [Xylaria cf. heliscus]|nr:hypothetical protein F4859DRAFT_495403 [Xylaria cf. heliscus]